MVQVRGDQILDHSVTTDDIKSGTLYWEDFATINDPVTGFVLAMNGSGESGSYMEWVPRLVVFSWVLNQRIRTGTTQDAIRIAHNNLEIVSASISLVSGGIAGQTVIDVNVGNTGSAPTTIFTTQGNRPQVAGGSDWTIGTSGTPDIVTITAGQIITCDIDEIATGNPTDLTVQLYCEVKP